MAKKYLRRKKNEQRSEFAKFNTKKAKKLGLVYNNKDDLHINYIYNRKGNNLEYLSMTHTPPKDKSNDYVRLTRSVDPNDKRMAYINTISDSADFRTFGKRYTNYSFDDNDKKLVKSIIKKNKKGK